MVWGWYISGLLHGLLFVIVLFGGIFSRKPVEPVTFSEVQILSEAEYAALALRAPAPAPIEEPEILAPPAADEAPLPPAEDAPPPDLAEPEPPDAETPDPNPDVAVPAPLGTAEVQEEAPVIAPPEPLPEGPRVDAPVDRAPRVAPAPAPAPPPSALLAPDAAPAVAPAPEALPDELVEEADETAPEEAAPLLETEAEERPETTQLATSPRPRPRPGRPEEVALAEPEPEQEPDTPEPDATKPDAPQRRDPDWQSINDALAEALADSEEAADTSTDAPAADPGPPLTGGEKDNLRLAVRDCWNVGSLSTEAKNTIVTVFVALDREGRPATGSIRMVDFRDGSQQAAEQAFQAARRAIIRCG
ncbi:MAG: hypothetical protein AAF871_14485, partial [Pseudomonadota bacterium]